MMLTQKDWLKANTPVFNKLLQNCIESKLRGNNDILDINLLTNFLNSTWNEIQILNKKIDEKDKDISTLTGK